MIVQIYLKGQGIYLSLGSNGKIKYTEAADNESSKYTNSIVYLRACTCVYVHVYDI